MNSSFSKKRHILEANQRLEKRFLIERIENSLDVILKEQTTQNNPQTVNPKDKKWYENFPCLKRDVGMELLKPEKLGDGTFYLKNYNNDMYFPDGTVYLSSTKRFDVWYCLRSDLTYHKNDKDDAGYVEAWKKGWAVEFTGDLNTKAAPVTDKAPTQNGQKKIDQYWYKKFPCLTSEVAGRILKVKRMPDRSVVLHEEKYNVFYFEDGTAYYANAESNQLWYCLNSSFTTISFDINDEDYQNAIKNGMAIEYKGDLKLKPAPDVKSLETQVEDEPPKSETPTTPAQPSASETPATPAQPSASETPVVNNTQIVSPESQNKGESGQMTTEKSYLDLYNEIRRKKMLGPEDLKNCAQILRNWYDDWGSRVVYNNVDHQTLKGVAQYCVYQIKPNLFSGILGQKGGSVDRDTKKIIDILTGEGDPKISQTSKYRLQKRRG